MGMTAPALYRYYPALDALILELCTDLYPSSGRVRGGSRPAPAAGP